ncbi:MAG: hypothetical protein WAL91_12025 [Propionicimonas sp.]
MGGDFLDPTTATSRCGEPDTTHHLRLADIQRRDPSDDLFIVFNNRHDDLLSTAGNGG